MNLFIKILIVIIAISVLSVNRYACGWNQDNQSKSLFNKYSYQQSNQNILREQQKTNRLLEEQNRQLEEQNRRERQRRYDSESLFNGLKGNGILGNRYNSRR